MLRDPFGWFPSPLFNILFLLVFPGVYAVDYIIPRLINPGYQRQSLRSDNGSFIVITLAIFLAISISIYFRMNNIGILAGPFQWLGLFVMISGSAFREWALIHLGRYFSRTVQIESGHRVVSSGPYRQIRHPAYTGMIAIYVGLSMALGTWFGTLFSFLIVTAGLLYRIGVEEKALLDALDEEYRTYMKHTWRLFPGR